MEYRYIINPLTNRKVSIQSRKGQSILKEYVNQLGGGECAVNVKTGRCGRSPKHTSYPELCEDGPPTKGGLTTCRKVKGAKIPSLDANAPAWEPSHDHSDDSDVESHDEHVSRSRGRGRHDPDPYDRMEHRRRSGKRGDHEGLASLGYGGAVGGAKSACAGHVNEPNCPPGCKKITVSKGARRGQTYCRKSPAKSAPKKKSSSKSSRHSYDAYDRHETYRKPGKRGDHEGLASLGYGG